MEVRVTSRTFRVHRGADEMDAAGTIQAGGVHLVNIYHPPSSRNNFDRDRMMTVARKRYYQMGDAVVI